MITHEEDCPYRMVACPVMGCKMRIRLHLIENHMAEKHPKMSNGQWEILPERERDAVPCRFAVKSWLYGGTRIFAILISGTESLWHLLVIAACGRNDAEKLRAEIRLSSNLVPDCNDVFNRPGKDDQISLLRHQLFSQQTLKFQPWIRIFLTITTLRGNWSGISTAHAFTYTKMSSGST